MKIYVENRELKTSEFQKNERNSIKKLAKREELTQDNVNLLLVEKYNSRVILHKNCCSIESLEDGAKWLYTHCENCGNEYQLVDGCDCDVS